MDFDSTDLYNCGKCRGTIEYILSHKHTGTSSQALRHCHTHAKAEAQKQRKADGRKENVRKGQLVSFNLSIVLM